MKFSWLGFLLCISTFAYPQVPNAKDILKQTLAACDNLKTAKYVLRKKERLINGTLRESEAIIKLNVHPYKAYVYSVFPNPGAEVLYVAGSNSGNALVNPNKFPFINLNLSPFSPILREDQHHTSLDLGFAYITSVIKNNIRQNENYFYGSLVYEGETEWNKRSCYRISINNKNFGYIEYTVQPGENITTIAIKRNISDYMILSVNSGLKGYHDVKGGQVIKIPNSYAKQILLYVDKATLLPLGQYIYDDKGLFEEYELSSFILNPLFQPEEFTAAWKDYHF